MSTTPSDPQPQGPTWGSPQPPPYGQTAGQPPYGGHPQPGGGGYPQAGSGAYPPAGHQGGPAGTNQDERTMATIAHLSTIAALILSAGWLSFVGPLIIWAIYKDRSPLVRQAAAGSFNFNLGLWVMNVVAWILLFTLVLAPVAVVLFVLANVWLVVWHLLAAYRASQGRAYRYPFQIRVLR